MTDNLSKAEERALLSVNYYKRNLHGMCCNYNWSGTSWSNADLDIPSSCDLSNVCMLVGYVSPYVLFYNCVVILHNNNNNNNLKTNYLVRFSSSVSFFLVYFKK